MTKVPEFIKRNKYKIISVLFVVWIVCFDEVPVTDWVQQYRTNSNTNREIKKIKLETLELERQIEALNSSGDSIEKYAREHFYMHYDNEDIYIFE